MSIEWNFETEKVRKVTSLKVYLVLLKAYKVLPEVLACNGLSAKITSQWACLYERIHIPITIQILSNTYSKNSGANTKKIFVNVS